MFILLLHTSVRAQQLQASLLHYSTDDGLASNAIAHIIQDDYGYIWIATWNGLSRFDGYKFYNYKINVPECLACEVLYLTLVYGLF